VSYVLFNNIAATCNLIISHHGRKRHLCWCLWSLPRIINRFGWSESRISGFTFYESDYLWLTVGDHFIAITTRGWWRDHFSIQFKFPTEKPSAFASMLLLLQIQMYYKAPIFFIEISEWYLYVVLTFTARSLVLGWF
jgi:hypothetical protein